MIPDAEKMAMTSDLSGVTVTPRAVFYARCSTEEEPQKDALAKQAAEAGECIRRMGWRQVDAYIESRSGTSTRKRTEYNRLLADLETDKFDIIVIKSQDRLMRNTKDWYLFVDRLSQNAKKLYIYLERKFYTADDALITGIKAILAEEYSRELSKKINNAHHNRQKNGGAVILTSNAYGYRRQPDGSITLVPEEAEIKRRMYELCAAGYGSRRIAAILKKDGVRNRKGTPFSDASILRMVKNPMNKGTVVMGRVHYDFDSKQTVRVPEEKQYVYENKIPAIVSGELWEQANREIARRSQKRKGGAEKYPPGGGLSDGGGKYSLSDRLSGGAGKYPLSGKLICGFCGAVYYRTVRRSKDGRKIYEWKCSRYLGDGRCETTDEQERRSVSEDGRGAPEGCRNLSEVCRSIHLKEEDLLELLEQTCLQYCTADKEQILKRLSHLLRRTLQQQDCRTEIERAQKQKERTAKQMQVLLDKLLSGTVTDEIYQMKYEELKTELDEAQKKLQTLEQKEASAAEPQERIARIEEAVRERGLFERAAVIAFLEKTERIIVYPAYMEAVFKTAGDTGAGNTALAETAVQIRIAYGGRFDYAGQKREKREAVAAMMRENPQITAKEIAEKRGVSLSQVNYDIRALKKEGRIRFVGKGGRGYWEETLYTKRL